MIMLTQCRDCRAMFLDADTEDWGGGEILQFCPRCGNDSESFDEVPDYFELAWFWQIIEHGFDLKERQVLKLLALRAIDLPDA